uniref:Uncharacterized protein n=1 Tax=Strix occidentalis caurina TaxID=311401 RepID=A0A8D0G2B3_STROC
MLSPTVLHCSNSKTGGLALIQDKTSIFPLVKCTKTPHRQGCIRKILNKNYSLKKDKRIGMKKFDSAYMVFLSSLNGEKQKQELRRVNQENRAILDRITKSQSHLWRIVSGIFFYPGTILLPNLWFQS